MPDLGHKRVSDHQGLKDMEVLKTCIERYGGPQTVAKKIGRSLGKIWRSLGRSLG